MKRATVFVVAIVLALLLLGAGYAAVTNFGAIHISDANPTSIPALKVNQIGAGKIVEFSDAATPIFSVNNGGAVRISIPTAVATAVPGVMIQGYGVGNPLEVRNVGGTPVFAVDADGNTTYTGFTSAGGVVNAEVAVIAPTAAGTATPAMVVDSLGAGNVLLDIRDSATPVFSINNGGGWTSTGAGAHASGQTVNSWAKVAAPTAIATATPAMVVDSLGVSTILEVRDAATPVFTVRNGGEAVAANGLTITTGGLTVTAGDVAFTNGWINFGAQSTFTVVDTLPITPTGTFQPLDSSGAVACDTSNCIEDGATVGDLLILQNINAADAITIDGTGGNVECKADVVLGAQDTLWLMWNGADWICLATHDNS